MSINKVQPIATSSKPKVFRLCPTLNDPLNLGCFALIYVLSDNNNPDDFEIAGELDGAASILIKSMLDSMAKLKPETIQKRKDFTFRLLQARLTGHNVQHADEFVLALRNLMDSPQRETIQSVLESTVKMLR